MKIVRLAAALAAVPIVLAGAAEASVIKVTITSLAPQNGTFLTPVWVGFHNGAFDIYDAGAPASAALERLAEDGNTAPLSAAFAASGAGGIDATILGPVGAFGPGQSSSMLFDIDLSDPSSAYFSYASMVIPSNDAFVANGDPLAFRIVAADGTFTGASFVVLGGQVLDAGTEVSDELPASTAFFGQAAPDTGTAQNGTVAAHPGFLPTGSGGILDSASFANADFLQGGYQIARISVELIPEPTALAGFGAGLMLLAHARRRRRRAV